MYILIHKIIILNLYNLNTERNSRDWNMEAIL